MNASQQTGPVFWSSEALGRMSEQLSPALAAAGPRPMPNLAAASPPPMSVPPAPPIRTAEPKSAVAARSSAISLDVGRVVYEPYPIVALDRAIDKALCDEMLAQWPPQHFFRYRRELGSRYWLSDEANGTNYAWYIENTPLWRELHAYVTRRDFIDRVLGTLAERRIDTGYRPEQITSRLEFTMISGEGGHAMPHTDPPGRVATIELFITAADQWDSAWGGGVAMLKPTDIARNFNVTNQPARFEEMTCLETFPYVSGCGVMIVKTFNAYRAIYPMTGPPQSLRRSLLITLDDSSRAGTI